MACLWAMRPAGLRNDCSLLLKIACNCAIAEQTALYRKRKNRLGMKLAGFSKILKQGAWLVLNISIPADAR
jgi:hypothetical protein